MLDIKTNKKQIYKYLFISIFFLIFGIIYEMFSHGVYSTYMMYAFLIPLILGFVTYFIIYITSSNKYLNELSMKIFNCSIITLTIGSVIKGVLEIYGTTNNFVSYYLIIGIILMIISILNNIIYNIRKKVEYNEE